MSQKQIQSSTQKALFNTNSAPPGGTCLSSFLVISRGGEILVGKMSKPEIWIERFLVGKKFASVYVSSGKYILPASHLTWYESPIDAAYRVVSNMTLIKAKKEDIKLLEVQSHVSSDPGNPAEPPHWDICFVYELKLPHDTNIKAPEWFQELQFVDKRKLKPQDFTRGHGDVLEQAGVISKV